MRDGKPFVLIVEGNEERAAKRKSLLEKELYGVSVQKDAKQAVDYLRGNPYVVDLIITALELNPLNGSGLDLATMLKITPKMEVTPIILVMDDLSRPEFDRALDSGIEDVFSSDMDDRLFVIRVRNAIANFYKPDYSNVMEEIIVKELNKHADTLGVCQCKQCKNDIITLTLNNLKPRYVSSEKGKLLATVEQMNRDYIPQMLRVLTECAERIRKNPRHQI